MRPAGSRTSVVTFAAKGKDEAEPRKVPLEDYRNIGIMVRPDTHRYTQSLDRRPLQRMRCPAPRRQSVLDWHSHLGGGHIAKSCDAASLLGLERVWLLVGCGWLHETGTSCQMELEVE